MPLRLLSTQQATQSIASRSQDPTELAASSHSVGASLPLHSSQLSRKAAMSSWGAMSPSRLWPSVFQILPTNGASTEPTSEELPHPLLQPTMFPLIRPAV